MTTRMMALASVVLEASLNNLEEWEVDSLLSNHQAFLEVLALLLSKLKLSLRMAKK